MRVKTRDTFTTIRTEGAILPPDLLARISDGDRDLGGLRREDYHLSGETINEAISRSWNRLLGVWTAFKDRREALPEGEPETGMTRERWLLPLFEELRYGRLRTARAVEIEGKTYPVSHDWYGTPIHLVGFRTDLDRRTPGVAGAARTSPHGLVQELLNSSEDRLWAFLSNGLRLRILRDNVSLTRQAYVEFDLEAMMNGEIYPDFVLLWLLCQQSRVEAERPEECWLEQWYHAASQQGARALDRLRIGVEEAIKALGSGFLRNRANEALRGKLRSGELEAQDYYRQLLRLVYRLLFLFVAEDRGLLLHSDADPKAIERYTRYYSTRKLRDVAEKRVGARHPDLYRALSLVMQKLGDDNGCPELGLPALGSFLFSDEAMPDLTGAEISNRDLLDAVRALSLVDYGGSRRPVDYKNLGSEELGSVYESLLELQPELDPASGTFVLSAVTGNERKTTGSYYTPHSLVTSLLDTALNPVLDEAAKKPDPEAAILDLKVCDPAVGSGHFLIAAAHRMARRLASVRTGDDEPSPEATREALRDVIGRCLYGVDVNPMAAELCKVSLWMEALVPGRPLSFLDHHIRVGNSLLGTTPELISGGIPDDAFKPIEGDDKKLTAAYKKRNREERAAWESGQLAFSLHTLDREREAVERAHAAVERTGDRSMAEVREKTDRYAALENSEEMFHHLRLADAWCAAFVWPKREGAPEPITQEIFADLSRDARALPPATEEELGRIAHRYNFFHWHLAFPNVFDGKDGFDVVLGNPPWEQIQLDPQEFFAVSAPHIAKAPNMSARNRLIKNLGEENPALYDSYLEGVRQLAGLKHFLHSSGRYPLTSYGRLNSAPLFAELFRATISSVGRVGCIVPTSIATDSFNQYFFGDLVDTKTLASLYDFENRKKLFPAVDSRMKFSLLTMTGSDRPVEVADFSFFSHDVADLKDPERRFPLSAEDIRLLNPNTRTCPIFRTRRDAEITKAIYRRIPVLVDEHDSDSGNPWGFKGLLMFMMNTDSGLFRTREELEAGGWELEGNVFHKSDKRYLPLYEAKMLHHYDHRWATYTPSGATRDLILSEKQDPATVAMPRYWVSGKEVEERTRNRWAHDWLLGFRRVARTTDERSAIFTVLPASGPGDSVFLMMPRESTPASTATLFANLDSIPYDFVVRQKVGGMNFNFYIVEQLPVLLPNAYDGAAPWNGYVTLRDWISPRVLELTYTAHDLAPFARDLGYEGPPFRWDPERRFLLRCELDAAFFHLYGIGRSDSDYIMETFPIVKRKDEAAHGEYRTKRVILEIYDRMARAAETGEPYRTPLDPPPVDLGGDRPATVTPLRPRKERYEPRPEKVSHAAIAAEDRRRYEPRTRTDAPADAHPEGKDSPDLVPERQEDNAAHAARSAGRDQTKPAGGLAEGTHAQSPAPEVPNPQDAALALHACIPDGEKVQKDALLADAARELGYPRLTKKVRRALSKVLNVEHNAGRLKTDWQLVWRPRKR